MPLLHHAFPRIGMRNTKTAIAATLCAVLYAIVDRNPTFACIGAVFAMNSSLPDSWETGGNRLWGTILGGFTGMLFFYLYCQMPNWLPASRLLEEAIFLFVGIMAMIWLCQCFGVHGAIPSGSVVFYIVMLNTPEHQYVSYALNRMLDTGIGVYLSILVNLCIPAGLSHSPRAVAEEIAELTEEKADYNRRVEAEITALERFEEHSR